MVLSSSSLSPWHFSSFKISRILGTFFQDITPRDHKTGHSAAAQERCLDVNTVSIIHQRRLLAIHLHLQEYSIQHSAHNLCQLLSWPHTNHGQCGTPSRLQDTFSDSKCQETFFDIDRHRFHNIRRIRICWDAATTDTCIKPASWLPPASQQPTQEHN